MPATSPSHRIDIADAANLEMLGNSCTLLIQVRGNWIKAKSDLTLQEALLDGATAARRSALPVQVRGPAGEVLAEL